MKTCFDCKYLCQDSADEFVCTAGQYEDSADEYEDATNCPDFKPVGRKETKDARM